MYNTIKLSYLLCILGLLCLPFSASAADPFPAQNNFAGQTLVLNGKGTRTKLVFNLYNAGLYLTTPNTDANGILRANQAMALRLQVTSGRITSENMESAVRDGFRLSAGGQLPALQPRIEQLISVFKTPIKSGDIYDFIYRPQNTVVVKNGTTAATIAGADFKAALFGIWLGTHPVQADLKSALLGEAQ